MQKDNNKQMIVLERNIVQLVKRYSGTMTVLLNDISEISFYEACCFSYYPFLQELPHATRY